MRSEGAAEANHGHVWLLRAVVEVLIRPIEEGRALGNSLRADDCTRFMAKQSVGQLLESVCSAFRGSLSVLLQSAFRRSLWVLASLAG